MHIKKKVRGNTKVLQRFKRDMNWKESAEKSAKLRKYERRLISNAHSEISRKRDHVF